MTDFVAGVIDGVDIPVGTEDPLAAFADASRDRTPVSIFDFAEARLATLAAAIRAAFPGAGLTLRTARLSTRSWREPWQADYAGVGTADFVVRPIGAAAPAVPAGRILI